MTEFRRVLFRSNIYQSSIMEEEASQHSTVHKEQNESKAIPSEYIELDLNKIKEFMYILYITLFYI